MSDIDFWDDFLDDLDFDDDDEEEEVELQTLIMCGCGQHAIDGRKDPYQEHNRWIEGISTNYIENSFSIVQNLKGIGVSAPKRTHSYDFSGDEFEVTNEQLRKFKK